MTLRRLSALLIAALALTGLMWQFQINGSKPGLSGWGICVWLMLRCDTKLANLMVAAVMMRAAIRPPGANATATPSIIMVGLIYQLFLVLPEATPAPHW